MKYQIKFYDDSGILNKIEYNAESYDSVISFCNSSGITPVEIKEISEGIVETFKKLILSIFNREDINDNDILEILDALIVIDEGHMQDAVRSEYLLESATTNKMRKKMEYVVSRLSQGRQLSTLLSEIGVPDFISYSIFIGEQSGSLLSEVLKSLKNMVQLKLDIKREIKNMLIVPYFIAAFICGLFMLMFFYIFPKQLEFLESMNIDWNSLPNFVNTIYDFARWANESFFKQILTTGLIVGTILLIIFSLHLLFRFLVTIKGMPLIGKIWYTKNVSIIFNLLYVSLRSNTSLEMALQNTINAVEDNTMKEKLMEVRNSVSEGLSLSEAFKRSNIFNEKKAYLFLKNYESTSNPSYLEYMSKLYTAEFKNSILTASKFINPILLVIIGAVVIFMYAMLSAPTLYGMQSVSNALGGS